MTPPDVWTSEPPSESGWYFVRAGEGYPLEVLWLARGCDMTPFGMPTMIRSVAQIPSLERLAALEELASASLTYFGLHQRTDIDGGDVLAAHHAMVAAIARVEESK